MIEGPIVLRYKGKKLFTTLNALKTKWAWYKAQQYYRREFIDLFEENDIPKVKAFSLEVTFNTKHDCDNMVGIAKFFVDTFRELKYVKNDDKAFYKSLKLSNDSTLPKQTVEFKIIPEEGDANKKGVSRRHNSTGNKRATK